MEIDENLKYTLYVTHSLLDPFSFTNLDILAFNSILVPVQENQWCLVARRTTSCRYEKNDLQYIQSLLHSSSSHSVPPPELSTIFK